MFVSRIVAALFVLVVVVFVTVATLLKDPADTATRLPADLDVVNIELATEPFDALAGAYDPFDVMVAGQATRDLVAEKLTELAINDLEIDLSSDEIEQIVTDTVNLDLTDQDIEAFHDVLIAGIPTVDPEEGEETQEEDLRPEETSAEKTPENALILTAAEQRVVNFGDAVGARAVDLMLAMQAPGADFAKALKAQERPALLKAVQPRLTRVQRVAYLAVPVETYIHHTKVTGSTAANRRSEVRARTGSTVASIYADRGDYIDVGQVLLVLNEDGREAQRSQAIATIAQAEANLVSAEAAIGSAEAQFAQGETSLSDAQEAQSDIIALGDFASATQRRNAQSAVDQATQSLNVAKAGLAQAEASLAQSQANLESARANLVQIDLDIERLTIAAPFSGRIEARNVEVGSSVHTGDPIFTLADLDTMIATARVSDSLRQSLSIGDIAEVIVGGGDTAKTFRGPITLIDTTSDAATRTFEVEVQLTNEFVEGQPMIVDNQFATITFAQAAEQVVRIPQSALTSASISSKPDGTTGLLTIDQDGKVAFIEITFADYADGGELLINADRVGGQDIRLIVGRGGFVKIGDLVDAREKLTLND